MKPAVEEEEFTRELRTVGGDPKSFPARSQGSAAAGQFFIDSAIASYLHISNFQGSLLHSEAFPWQPPGDTKQLFLPEWAALLPRLLEKAQQWCTRAVSTLDRRLQFGQQPPLLTHLVLGLPLEDVAGGF